MKKLLTGIAVTVGVISMAFISAFAAETQVETVSEGKLIVGTEAGFAPYEYLVGDKVEGIDMDIAQAIADALGLELEVQNMDFDGALLAVQQGKVDLVAAGVSVSEERENVMDFSVKYVDSRAVVVVNAADPKVDASTADALTDKVVGVQQGNIADLWVSENTAPKSVQRYTNLDEAVSDLANGRIDCIVMDETPAQKLAASGEGLQILEGDALFEDSYAIAIRKGNEAMKAAVDNVIIRLQESGQMDEIIASHSADGDGEAVSVSAPGSTDDASDDLFSYDEYAAAEMDTLVTIEAYVQAKQAWYEDNSNMGTDTATLYLQDEDGGYFLYDIPCTKEVYEQLEKGTKVRVTGYKSEWAGEVEIIADDDLTPVEIIDGSYIAEPVDVTDIVDDEEILKMYQNRKAAFTGMTVEPAADGENSAFLYGWDGSGSEGDDLYFRASKDGTICTFVVESYLCGPDTPVYQAVKNLNTGDIVDLVGFLYWYEGPQPHITGIGVNGEGIAEAWIEETEAAAVEAVEELLEETEAAAEAVEELLEETEAAAEEPAEDLIRIEETEAAAEVEEPEETEKIKSPNFKTFFWGDDEELIRAKEGDDPDYVGELNGVNAHYIGYDTKASGLNVILAYYFCDSGLYSTRYVLTEKHSVETKYIDDYNTIKSAITKKYGEPLIDNKSWDTDSHEDYYAGREGDALSYGYLTFSTVWVLDDTYILMNLSADNYDISLTIDYESKDISPGDPDYSDDF